jgi:indole-3-glycerol phosphate synthase
VSERTATVLQQILESTRAELQRRRQDEPLESLRERALQSRPASGAAVRSLARAIAQPPIGVIAEFKRRSPSAGTLRERADAAEIARAYEQAGARGLSVLTEGPHFEGSLEDLRAARAATGIPILRKDFIVDPYQLYEALLAGADAVLLIVAALAEQELVSLHDLARELGLEALVEVHDGRELQIALAMQPAIVGINNRDLRDFSVDVGRTERLMGQMPGDVRVVSESGISGPEQLAGLAAMGVDAVLVGESLMRAGDAGAALRELLAECATRPGA